MCEGLPEKLLVARINNAAAPARDMRFAIHRREGGDIPECADGPSTYLGAVRLAAVLDHADAARMRLAHDLAHVHRLADGMHDHHGAHVRTNTRHELLDLHPVPA